MTNPVPFTVRVNWLRVAVAKVGLKLVMADVGTATIGNEAAPDVVPSLFITVTVADPILAISVWLTSNPICPASVNVVARGTPFHRATAVGLNPAPITVNSNALPPTVA